MKGKRMLTIPLIAGLLALVSGWAISAQDKYTLKVPNGLSFSEFRGYEAWQIVSISQNGDHVAAIVANPAMIKAYLAGAPGNGKPSTAHRIPHARYRPLPVISLRSSTATRSCAARGVTLSSRAIRPADRIGRATTRSASAGRLEFERRPTSLRSS